MDDTQKMLQAIINGQSVFRQEVLSRLNKLEAKLEGMINKVEKNLTGRIDKLGKQLAYLGGLKLKNWYQILPYHNAKIHLPL